jgi:hypothetical protein
MWDVSRDTVVSGTSLTYDFVGAQPGRWRVQAIDADGIASEWSDLAYFRYVR